MRFKKNQVFSFFPMGILLLLGQAYGHPSKPHVMVNGDFASTELVQAPTINGRSWGPDYLAKSSENGVFQIVYAMGKDRTVQSLEFFENGNLLFTLPHTLTQAVNVSNDGTLLLVTGNFETESANHFSFYSKTGQFLLERKVSSAEVAQFSNRGNFFGIALKNNLEVIDVQTGKIAIYPTPSTGKVFDISNEGSVVAVGYQGGLSIYRHGSLAQKISTGFVFNRSIKISPDLKSVAIADVRNVQVFGLTSTKAIYSQQLTAEESISEIKFGDQSLWVGVKLEKDGVRSGLLKSYSLIQGIPSAPSTEIQISEPIETSGLDYPAFQKQYKETQIGGYGIYPWPMLPQNEAHMLWNNFEGLNSSENGFIDNVAGYPYLHQGLDMECPANTAIYSIDTGLVRYYGDLGGMGDKYWRIAVTPSRDTGWTNGWMYAHMIDTTIKYKAGDRIPMVGLLLGKIVPWSGDIAGHLHLNEIRDHGASWNWADDEWGVTYNPELSIRPNPDATAPIIVPAITGKSKFGYCPNKSGYGTKTTNYFYPDSARGGVKGDIDIVLRAYDIKKFTNHQQPPISAHYWIKGIDKRNGNYNQLIIDTTLGALRNHPTTYYSAAKSNPIAQVAYKIDSVFIVGGWFNRVRTFAQVLTNNNGDSTLNLGETDSALHTAKYPDGWYRLYVKAKDAAGNATVDSENVYFKNGNISGIRSGIALGKTFSLDATNIAQASFPISIQYSVPSAEAISLRVLDLKGMEIKTLIENTLPTNSQNISWNGSNNKGQRMGRGLYLIELRQGSNSVTQKLLIRQ